MKKKIGGIISAIILVILLQTQLGSAVTFGVSIGDSFTYDCVTAERSIVWGTDTSDSDGYQLDGHNFASGTSVSVNVTNIISDSVFYIVSKDGYDGYYWSDLQSMTLTSYFSYVHFILVMKSSIGAYIGEFGWNQTLMDEGPGIPIDNVFIETDATTWTTLIDLVDAINTVYSTATDFAELTMDAGYVDDGSIFACEFHVSGIKNATYTPFTSPATPWTDYSDDIDYYYRFAYDKATGTLLGMHLYGSMTGIHNGTNYEFSLDSHVEKEGYDLPDDIFATGGFSGYSIALTLGCLTTVFMIAIVIRRKKITN